MNPAGSAVPTPTYAHHLGYLPDDQGNPRLFYLLPTPNNPDPGPVNPKPYISLVTNFLFLIGTTASGSHFPIRGPPSESFFSVSPIPGGQICFLIHCSDYVIPHLRNIQCLRTALKMKSKLLGVTFICISSLLSHSPSPTTPRSSQGKGRQ